MTQRNQQDSRFQIGLAIQSINADCAIPGDLSADDEASSNSRGNEMTITRYSLIAAIMRAKDIDTFWLPERYGISGGYHSLAEIKASAQLQTAIIHELREAGYQI